MYIILGQEWDWDDLVNEWFEAAVETREFAEKVVTHLKKTSPFCSFKILAADVNGSDVFDFEPLEDLNDEALSFFINGSPKARRLVFRSNDYGRMSFWLELDKCMNGTCGECSGMVELVWNKFVTVENRSGGTYSADSGGMRFDIPACDVEEIGSKLSEMFGVSFEEYVSPSRQRRREAKQKALEASFAKNKPIATLGEVWGHKFLGLKG
ncbi:hypothetical protein IPM19_01825 [bacterium]|nr:MAG: hypothetical protein IPM19_01825 [bacterium]